MKRVLVLGAGGYIGRHAVAALARCPDLAVTAAARRPLPGLGVPALQFDALDRPRLHAAMRGAEVVVNCVVGDARTIVDGAQALACGGADGGLPRLVHLSTMRVYGRAQGRLREDAPLRPDAGWYSAAKCAAEQALQAHAASGGELVLLRPGCVYGAGSDAWVGRMARLLRAGRLGDLAAAGDGPANLVHVDDVSAAIVQCVCSSSAPPHHAYNLAAPGGPSWNAYFWSLAKALGLGPLRRIPAWQLQCDARGLSMALKAVEVLGRRAGLRMQAWPDALPPSLLALFGQDIELDSTAAQTELALRWTPLQQALTDAAAWWVAQGRGG